MIHFFCSLHIDFLVAVVAELVAEFFGTATAEKPGISRVLGWLVAEVAVLACLYSHSVQSLYSFFFSTNFFEILLRSLKNCYNCYR